MTTHLGNEGKVKINATTLGEVTSFSITESVETPDDSQLTDEWNTHKAGSKAWRGSCECHWDENDSPQNALTVGASVTFSALPEGDGSGATYFTGTATVTQVVRSNARNGIVSAAFEFLGNGALSKTTV